MRYWCIGSFCHTTGHNKTTCPKKGGHKHKAEKDKKKSSAAPLCKGQGLNGRCGNPTHDPSGYCYYHKSQGKEAAKKQAPSPGSKIGKKKSSAAPLCKGQGLNGRCGNPTHDPSGYCYYHKSQGKEAAKKKPLEDTDEEKKYGIRKCDLIQAFKSNKGDEIWHLVNTELNPPLDWNIIHRWFKENPKYKG